MKKQIIPCAKAKTFEELLLETIDQALSSLSESSKIVIYTFENYFLKSSKLIDLTTYLKTCDLVT